MKQFLIELLHKADDILEQDLATKGRSVSFRVTTLVLIAATVGCISYYLISQI